MSGWFTILDQGLDLTKTVTHDVAVDTGNAALNMPNTTALPTSSTPNNATANSATSATSATSITKYLPEIGIGAALLFFLMRKK